MPAPQKIESVKCPHCGYCLGWGELSKIAFRKTYTCKVCNGRSIKQRDEMLALIPALIVYWSVGRFIQFSSYEMKFLTSLFAGLFVASVIQKYWQRLAPVNEPSSEDV